MLIDALSVLCAQLTRDLLAIANFLFFCVMLFTEVNAAAAASFRQMLPTISTAGL